MLHLRIKFILCKNPLGGINHIFTEEEIKASVKCLDYICLDYNISWVQYLEYDIISIILVLYTTTYESLHVDTDIPFFRNALNFPPYRVKIWSLGLSILICNIAGRIEYISCNLAFIIIHLSLITVLWRQPGIWVCSSCWLQCVSRVSSLTLINIEWGESCDLIESTLTW